MTQTLLIFLTGLVTGFLDSTVGAGGLVAIPALVFLGLPPHAAIATDRLGTLGQEIAALIKFSREKKIVWRATPALSVLALLGSVLGAHLLLDIPAETLQKSIAVLMVALLPLLLRQPRQVRHERPSARKRNISFALYFLLAVLGGCFGQGTGPFAFYILTAGMGLTMVEALATNTVPWLLITLSSLFIFARDGIVNASAGMALLPGMMIGSYVGAHIAIKKGDAWLRMAFAIFVVIAAAKLLFFP